MRHIMLYSEPLGNKSGAAVLSVAAAVFDTSNIYSAVGWGVDLGSCLELGMHIDKYGVQWLLEQPSDRVRSVLDGMPIGGVLHSLKSSFDWRGATVWYDGLPTCLSLYSAFDSVGMEAPWNTWECRDLRTVSSILGHEVMADVRVAPEVAYNPKDEVLARVRTLQGIWRV